MNEEEKNGLKEDEQNLDDSESGSQEGDAGEEIEVQCPDEQRPQAEKVKESKEKEYYERLLYLTAEFDNYKKRVRKEKAEYVQFATERLIKELIPIIDNFERALGETKESDDNKAILDGVKLIYNQLNALLKKQGVKSIDSLGKTFDPLIHEAISHIPSKEHEPNTVISEQCKAYFMGNKLIRPATVVVSKAFSQDEAKDDLPKQNEDSDESSQADEENSEEVEIT